MSKKVMLITGDTLSAAKEIARKCATQLLEDVEDGKIDYRKLSIEDRDSLNAEWRSKYLNKK